MRYFLFLLIFFFIEKYSFPQSPDSTYVQYIHDTLANTSQSNTLPPKAIGLNHLQLFFSTSFTINQNWQSNDYKYFILLGDFDYLHRFSSEKFIKLYEFRGELSFVQYTDSIQISPWYKNSDFFNISAQWTEFSSKSLKHSYSFIVKSQFLDTWKYSLIQNGLGGPPNTIQREWIGSIMNPATITLAYGLNYLFWQNSYINFALSTINVYTRPRLDDVLRPTEQELARTSKLFIVSDYGVSIQASIEHKFNEHLYWYNKSNFFSGGINKNQVNLDFQNRIIFTFLKYFQFRMSTYLVYNPIFSHKMQYQNEFLTGIFFENKTKNKKPLQ